MKQIKIYLNKRSELSPFSDNFSEQYLKSKGIVYTSNPLIADVIMSVSPKLGVYKVLKKLFYLKKFIIWTNEPRFSTSFQNFAGKQEPIMDVYSGDVFFHNLHFLGSYHYNFSVDLGINLQSPAGTPLTFDALKKKSKFCAAFFSYREPNTSKLFIHNKNIDLNAKRQDLAYFLYKHQKVDIFGSGWPESVQVAASCGYETENRNWWDSKINSLKDYKFNICFENTIAPYYCTEKIWHAIAGGCLPIYYGQGTKIYETFPQDSFIDAATFKTHEDLLHFLENISSQEFIQRYNLCLKIMHEACSQRLKALSLKTEIIDKYVDKVRLLTVHTN